MNFVSFRFVVFIVVVIALYFFVPKRYRWLVLLSSSLLFYFEMAGIVSLLVVLFTTLFSYGVALRIESGVLDYGKKQLYVVIGIIILLAILAVVKIKRYLFPDAWWVIVPLGISYYTFSIIGYLVDVYYKKQKPEKNFFKYLLYILFFPKIMQGPISKYKEIGPRLIEGHDFNYNRCCFGMQRICYGYFKKLVIVERVAQFTANIFDGDLTDCSAAGVVLLFATIVGVISFYCDFSGYMDIVIGISEIMGIELEENFRQPFLSTSAAEFWRRWHITLGVWFRDYVYMPLIVNQKLVKLSKSAKERYGKAVGKGVLTIIPIMIVWFLTGLWHATGTNYLIWGIYWGVVMVLELALNPLEERAIEGLRIKKEAWGWKCFKMIRTFCEFSCGLLISQFVGIRQLAIYFKSVFGHFELTGFNISTLSEYGMNKANLIIVLLSICFIGFVDVCESHGSVRLRIAQKNVVSRSLLYAILVLAIIVFGIYGPEYAISNFGYVNF